jgi:molybdate transport system substrate-binding protein
MKKCKIENKSACKAEVLMWKSIILFITIFVISACSQTPKEEITVSAAASLKDALEEIKVLYKKENPTVEVYYNFGSTGALQQQIIQGAPTDVFFSASKEKFVKLKQKGLLAEDQSVDLLHNTLVLIGKNSTNHKLISLHDLEGSKGQIAIGTPETVPAGAYAKEALQSIGMWDTLQPRIVPGKDVRQVLSYVESGNVTFGIVYYTDAILTEKVQILSEFDRTLHSPVTYSVGIVEHTKNQKEAEAYYQFLKSETAISIFEKYGFKGLNK